MSTNIGFDKIKVFKGEKRLSLEQYINFGQEIDKDIYKLMKKYNINLTNHTFCKEISVGEIDSFVNNTGIKELYYSDKSTSEIAVHVGEQLLSELPDEKRKKLYNTIFSTAVLQNEVEYCIPARLQFDLKLKKNPSPFSISQASSVSWTYALNVAMELMLVEKDADNFMIISSDKIYLPFPRFFNNEVVFNDSGAAILLEKDAKNNHIRHIVTYEDSDFSDPYNISNEALISWKLKLVESTVSLINKLLKEYGIKIDDIKVIFPDSLNRGLVNLLLKKLDYPFENVFQQIQNEGSFLTSGPLINLDQYFSRNNKLNKGDLYLIINWGINNQIGLILIEY